MYYEDIINIFLYFPLLVFTKLTIYTIISYFVLKSLYFYSFYRKILEIKNCNLHISKKLPEFAEKHY